MARVIPKPSALSQLKPRSGERSQPTAQAVGELITRKGSPEGAKEIEPPAIFGFDDFENL
jgi:hypothetical protein